MGTAALIFPVGSILISSFNMYTLAILCVALAGAFAAPEAEPVADAHYVPVLYNSYPDWPGVQTPYSSSTCFGCRGKREADADAHYLYPPLVPYLVLLATLDTLHLMLPGLPRVSVVRGRRRLMPTMDMDCMVVMDTTPIAMDTDSPMDMPDGEQ